MTIRLVVAVPALAAVVALLPPALQAQAQGRGRGFGGQPPLSGRAAAPIDITGYWVALVTDDWRYRMLTPPKGNVDYLPVNPAARQAADNWDPAADQAAGEQCRAFGAAGVMRLPGRLHITWEDDETLRLDTEAGTQTRRFRFRASQSPATTEPSWQGQSTAQWVLPGGGRGRGPAGTGQLMVTTTSMRPGYIRKNGVPYSADAVLREFFLRLVDDAGQEYLSVTTMVEDPRYLAQPYVKTYQFKKEPAGSAWSPAPCSAR